MLDKKQLDINGSSAEENKDYGFHFWFGKLFVSSFAAQLMLVTSIAESSLRLTLLLLSIPKNRAVTNYPKKVSRTLQSVASGGISVNGKISSANSSTRTTVKQILHQESSDRCPNNIGRLTNYGKQFGGTASDVNEYANAQLGNVNGNGTAFGDEM